MSKRKAEVVPLTWQAQISKKGEFQRRDAQFMGQITADGSSGLRAESGRYHLYVSYACPWAHRTLIVRELKGLQDAISVDVVHHFMHVGGWRFRDGHDDNGDYDGTVPASPGATVDSVNGFQFMKQVYLQSDPTYERNVSVPCLYDKKTKRIVCNESSEIIKMLNSEFNQFCATEEQKALDLYPVGLRKEMDATNDWIYHAINNGVYKAGFAKAQGPYDDAFKALFEGLDRAEELLGTRRYLCGAEPTLADVRLFTTLVRFDLVYVGHFKCNKKRVEDYPNLHAFTKDVYQLPGVAKTTNLWHIKHHYLFSHESVNPYRIVPGGPDVDFTTAHGRDTRKY